MIFSHERQQYVATDVPENTPPPQTKVMEELLSEGSAATLRFLSNLKPGRRRLETVGFG